MDTEGPLEKVCQGAKKITFTACHLGKLKLAFTSQTSFQLAPKAFRQAELISLFFFYSNSQRTSRARRAS